MSMPTSLDMAPINSLPLSVTYPQQQTLSPNPEVTPFSRYNPNLFRTPQLPRTPRIGLANLSNHVLRSSPNFKTPPK